MKRLCWIASLLLLASGCVLRPSPGENPLVQLAVPERAAALPAAPVTPEDVTVANAHDMANALWDEYDRDEQTPVCPPACPHCKKK